MPIRWIAVVGALALAAGAPALTACSFGAGHPIGVTAGNGLGGSDPAASVSGPALTAGGTAPGRSSSPPSSPARSGSGSPPTAAGARPAGATPAGSPSPTTAISSSDLAQVDQALADASNALGSVDQDATHNESGDSTP